MSDLNQLRKEIRTTAEAINARLSELKDRALVQAFGARINTVLGNSKPEKEYLALTQLSTLLGPYSTPPLSQAELRQLERDLADARVIIGHTGEDIFEVVKRYNEHDIVNEIVRSGTRRLALADQTGEQTFGGSSGVSVSATIDHQRRERIQELVAEAFATVERARAHRLDSSPDYQIIHELCEQFQRKLDDLGYDALKAWRGPIGTRRK